MPIYVLAKKDSEVIDTIVFRAGESGEEEAVALFTDEKLARDYLVASQWDEPHDVVLLEPPALLQWLLEAYGQRIGLLTIDPQRQSQLAGQPQKVLSIEEELKRCGESLAQRFDRIS